MRSIKLEQAKLHQDTRTFLSLGSYRTYVRLVCSACRKLIWSAQIPHRKEREQGECLADLLTLFKKALFDSERRLVNRANRDSKFAGDLCIRSPLDGCLSKNLPAFPGRRSTHSLDNLCSLKCLFVIGFARCFLTHVLHFSASTIHSWWRAALSAERRLFRLSPERFIDSLASICRPCRDDQPRWPLAPGCEVLAARRWGNEAGF